VLFGFSFWVDSSDCWFFKIFEITRITILWLWLFVRNSNKIIPFDTPLISFFLLAIGIFEYLYKQANMFLHNFVNAICSLKGLESFHLFVFVIFFRYKISIALQRMQASFILSWAVAVSLVTSWLSSFQEAPQIIMADLLQAHLLQWSIFDIETFWHLVWTNLTSCKFSLFFFLIHLYIFQIYCVFINKVLKGFIQTDSSLILK